MGLFDILKGNTKLPKANLDELFKLPGATITLEINANLTASGKGAVCYKPASGAAFENTVAEYQSVLDSMADSNTTYTTSTDSYGYDWVVITDPSIESLTTAIHAVNRSLEDHGFAQALLCSAFRFDDQKVNQPVYWIYMYKRGTFYPFVPTGPSSRNNERELTLKAIIGTDLPVEPDLASWMAPWGLPL